MADREKVEKGLNICNSINHPCNECPYVRERNCSLAMVKDALSLLKEQEVVLCRDCKYFKMHEWYDFHKRIWPKDGDRWYECLHPDDDGEHGTRTRGPDWFCADGERQEGR